MTAQPRARHAVPDSAGLLTLMVMQSIQAALVAGVLNGEPCALCPRKLVLTSGTYADAFGAGSPYAELVTRNRCES